MNIELSPSSISLYYECPYAFHLRYKRKIKLGEDIYTKFGKSIHLILEHFWDKNDLQKSITKYWDTTLPPEMFDSANLIFQNFLTKTLESPLFVEKELHSKKLGTVCHVDVIRLNKIEDYKTSASFTKKPKPRNIIQGIINILSVEECLDLNIEQADFLYLKLNKIQTIYPEERYISFVEDFIGKIHDSLMDNNFPKSGKCNSCYYRLICEWENKYIQRKLNENWTSGYC